MNIKSFLNKTNMPALIALSVLFCGFILSIIGFLALRGITQERLHIEAEQGARIQVEQLQTLITQSLSILDELADAYYISGIISPQKLSTFLNDTTQADIATLGLGWAPKILGRDLNDFEEMMHLIHAPEFHVYERSGHGFPLSVQPTESYYPIQFLSSISATNMKEGLNLGAIPSRRHIMEKAARQQSIALTQAITFYMADEAHSGIQAFYPLFEKGDSNSNQLVGHLFGLYDIAALINTVFQNKASPYDIVLLNPTAAAQQQLLYSSLDKIENANDVRQSEQRYWMYPIGVADQQWLAAIFPNALAVPAQTWLPYLGLISGSLFALLLALYLFLALMRASKVTQLTTDLQGSQSQLTVQRQLKTDADKANLAKSQLLRAASHDLRQPLHTINLLTTLLKNSKSKAEQSQLIDRTLDAVENMDDLFGALLDINLLESGEIQAIPEHFRLGNLLEKLAADYEVQAAEEEVYLSLINSSACVFTDPALLERILRNLLSNAVRYTQSGRILLGCRRQQSSIRICVFDTGIGLSKAAQHHIFDAFYRDDNARQLVDNGLGLGLAIVKETANLLNLNLGLESVLEKGTLFYIDVPYGDIQQLSSTATANQIASLPPSQAWVIEDDKSTQYAMTQLLQQWGCEVLAFASGSELQKLLSQEQAPSLIIADYQLVNETGLNLAQQACAHYQSSHIPVIIMTGTTDPGVRDLVQQADYQLLIKPIKPASLHKLIYQLLSE